MYTRIPLLLYLLATAVPSDAGLFSRSTEHLLAGVSSVHQHAIKRSSGLAKDLRRAFGGVLIEETSAQHAFCYVETSLTSSSSGNGSSSGSGSGSSSSSAQASGTSTASASSASSTSAWKLKQSYEGDTFFDEWTFFTSSDPTDGTVEYVDASTASSANLTSINSAGNAIMRVDTTAVITGNRQSVRITTNYNYTGALVLLDAVHAPTGCGTWPAFWSNGPDWPAGGEIDIVEGVNTYTVNQASIHTNSGCSLPSDNSTVLGITGTVVGGTDCGAYASDDQGCGVRSNSDSSFGAGFNDIEGGVYAMQWDDSGITVWFFERSAIPSDITSGSPDPTGWSEALATWPATDCNPSTYFYEHNAIFDTTLCGQWAGLVWNDTGVAGQSESCADMTGYSSCSDYVQNEGADFAEAYWEVKSVKIYQTS